MKVHITFNLEQLEGREHTQAELVAIIRGYVEFRLKRDTKLHDFELQPFGEKKELVQTHIGTFVVKGISYQ